MKTTAPRATPDVPRRRSHLMTALLPALLLAYVAVPLAAARKS